MSLYGAFDQTKHLDELDSPLVTNEGVLAPATRKARMRANLDVASTDELDAAILVAAQSRLVSIPDATTYTVLAANSGKTHVIPNLTANMTITLPTAAAGLEYLFIAKAVAADAQNWIIAAGVPYLGGIQFADTDEPASPALLTSVFPNGSSNDNMTIVTPSAATSIWVICDGTNWIVNGVVYSATVPTFAD